MLKLVPDPEVLPLEELLTVRRPGTYVGKAGGVEIKWDRETSRWKVTGLFYRGTPHRRGFGFSEKTLDEAIDEVERLLDPTHQW